MKLRHFGLPLTMLALVIAGCSAPVDGGDAGDGGSGVATAAWTVNQFGSTAGDMVFGLAPAGDGGVFAVGLTESALLPNTASLGGYDAFLLRTDASGSIVWAEQLGTPYNDFGKAVAVDANGYLFLGGYTNGDLDDNTVMYVGTNGFVAKFEPDGQEVWHAELSSPGSDEFDDEVLAVAADPADGVYAAGSTYGDLFGANQGGRDAFVVNYRLDASTNSYVLNWSKHLGSLGDEQLVAAITAPDGGVIVAGGTTADLGGDSLGGYDAVVMRYDPAGNLLWSKHVGTMYDDLATALAPAPDGGFYLAGMSMGELAQGEQRGSKDAFVARFDEAGNEIWIHQLGTGADEYALALAPDGQGGVYVAGSTAGSMVEDAHAGLTDAFAARYDADGSLLWLGQKGTEDNDQANAVVASGVAGRAFVGGSARGDLAGVGSQIGEYDAFIALVGP